jgi:hypothetical protein
MNSAQEELLKETPNPTPGLDSGPNTSGWANNRSSDDQAAWPNLSEIPPTLRDRVRDGADTHGRGERRGPEESGPEYFFRKTIA